jgi:hypothetical protein
VVVPVNLDRAVTALTVIIPWRVVAAAAVTMVAVAVVERERKVAEVVAEVVAVGRLMQMLALRPVWHIRAVRELEMVI